MLSYEEGETRKLSTFLWKNSTICTEHVMEIFAYTKRGTDLCVLSRAFRQAAGPEHGGPEEAQSEGSEEDSGRVGRVL